MRKLLASLIPVVLALAAISAAQVIPPQYQKLAADTRSAGRAAFIWPAPELAIEVNDMGPLGTMLIISGFRATSLTATPVPFLPAWRTIVHNKDSAEAEVQSAAVKGPESQSAAVDGATNFGLLIPGKGGLSGAGIVEIFLVAPTPTSDRKPISNAFRLVDVDKKQIKIAQ